MTLHASFAANATLFTLKEVLGLSVRYAYSGRALLILCKNSVDLSEAQREEYSSFSRRALCIDHVLQVIRSCFESVLHCSSRMNFALLHGN